MDIATLAGMGVGTAVVMLVMLLSGSLLMYWDLLSLVIVLGGAVCATLIRWPLDKFISGLMAGLDAVTNKIDSPEALIDKIEELATTARKESILALEKVSIENEDLEKMIKMAVDGITPDVIDSTFEETVHVRLMPRRKHHLPLALLVETGLIALHPNRHIVEQFAIDSEHRREALVAVKVRRGIGLVVDLVGDEPLKAC